MGERTWGKGSVQNVIELEEGRSALKLTTAGYLRPSGKNIHRFDHAAEDEEWGVMPDENYGIRFTNEQLRDYLDYRRQRDVLSKEGPPKADFKDEQLAKGVEFINGKLGGDAAEEKKTETEEETSSNTTQPPAESAQQAASRRLRTLKRAMRAAREGLRIYVGSAT